MVQNIDGMNNILEIDYYALLHFDYKSSYWSFPFDSELLCKVRHIYKSLILKGDERL